MRDASEVDGPLIVLLKRGEVLQADYIDGGGMSVHPDDPRQGDYEVHGRYTDGEFLNIPQREIAAVLDSDGQQVEFGNYYIDSHPRYRPLPDEEGEEAG